MSLREEIGEWASGTTNKSEPTAGEVAAGHPLGDTADSAMTNYHTGHQDREIVNALRAAQSASDFSHYSDDDDYKICANAVGRAADNWVIPGDGLCSLVLPHNANDMCTGKNFARNEQCVFISTSAGGVYRINTWDLDDLAYEEMDIDEAGFGISVGICCDKDYLYVLYTHTTTSTYHIGKLALATWTGLFVEDRDTLVSTSYPASICEANANYIGFFSGDGTTATFGVWAKDDTSFVTGSGNASSLPSGTLDLDNTQGRVISNGSHLFIDARNDSGAHYLMSAAISNPTTSTSPASMPTTALGSSLYKPALLPLSNSIILLGETGSMFAYHAETSWARDILITSSARDSASHRGSLCQVGTDVWAIYIQDTSIPLTGTNVHIAVRYKGTEMTGRRIDETITKQGYVPYGAVGNTGIPNIFSTWDGRHLVISVYNNATSDPMVYLITGPGRR